MASDEKILYYDRITGEKKQEKVYGGRALSFIYGGGRFLAPLVLFITAKVSLFSSLYGWWQKQSFTKRKIVPFIQNFNVDTSEFLKPASAFHSFNDFFCRKLKKEVRPLSGGDETAILPADGRCLVFPDISKCDGFFVKGAKFSLSSLLQDNSLAEEYAEGGLLMVRLSPVDYHRFHFPAKGIPGKTRLINGLLFSVNPIALIQNIHIFSENKRMVTTLDKTPFGKILMVEVGATCVGSMNQTFEPGKEAAKGDEKGFFSFGGSSMLVFFKKGAIAFSEDLVRNTQNHTETLCRMGQPLGLLTEAPYQHGK